jgi:hypothetical protein
MSSIVWQKKAEKTSPMYLEKEERTGSLLENGGLQAKKGRGETNLINSRITFACILQISLFSYLDYIILVKRLATFIWTMFFSCVFGILSSEFIAQARGQFAFSSICHA